MFELLSKRLIAAVFTLFVASVLYFGIVELLPGDFANARLGPRTTPEALDELRELQGLYRPVHIRYFDWLSQIVSGEFGKTWSGGTDIAPLLWQRLSNTLFLASVTALVAVPLAIVLGVVAAMRRNTRLDRVMSAGALAMLSIPEFVVGYGAVFLLAITLPLFPAVAVVSDHTGAWQRFYGISLPVFTLSMAAMPSIIRLTRASILNVLSLPFVEMAQLKGLGDRRIFWHHTLPHACAPIANVVILTLANLIVGVIVVEVVFAYPGIGQMLIDGVLMRDVPMVQACGLVFTCVYIVLVLLADIVTIISNPKIKERVSQTSTPRKLAFTMIFVAVLIPSIHYGGIYLEQYRLNGVTGETSLGSVSAAADATIKSMGVWSTEPTLDRDNQTESGELVDIFGARVVDIFGQIHRLGVGTGVSPFILIFIEETCPVSSSYTPELNRYHALAQKAGVSLYGVVSDPLTSADDARRYVTSSGFEFPVLWDPSGDLAIRLRPAVTPEVFVVSPKDTILYRGRIDDRFPSLGVLRNQITSHDLRDVISEIAAGKNLTPRRTVSVGCFFEAWGEGMPDDVTYTRDIAPIVNANCAECHRSGGVAPFPLETYSQVKRRARMVAHVTEQGLMPPWRAEKGFGSFRDERHLSPRQIGLLGAWSQTGAPKGDDANALPAPDWPSPRWQMGEPDLVIEMTQSFEIPATGADIYRYFVIPFELAEDQAIVGLEFRPGDPRAVHHSLAYVDYSGRARQKDAEDKAYGFSVFGTGGFFDNSNREDTQYIGGWAPGLDPIKLPPNHGAHLPGRSGDAVFEIHYRPKGKATSDRSRLGLYFAKKPVSRWVTGTVAGTLDVNIAPEDDNYWRQVYMDVPADITLIGVSPHMHYLGREVRAVATFPDGSRQPLLYIPAWDFRWQNIYVYREPLSLPAGSRIDAWFKFDNSSANPYNPHVPPSRVRWGWASDQEMCELWMRFAADSDSERDRVVRAGNRSWSRPAALTEPPPK